MKVKDLIKLLSQFNPEAEVVIHRENMNYGFGGIDRLESGLFEKTNYGNDFYPERKLITDPVQVSAVCLYPEDYVPE